MTKTELLQEKSICLSRVALAYEYLIMAQEKVAKEKIELNKIEQQIKELGD